MQKGWTIMWTWAKVRGWAYRCFLAVQLIVIVLLIAGGCYSKQNYRIMSQPASERALNRCNIVVEGRVVYVLQDKLKSWQQHVLCYPLTSEEASGPDRYNLSIDIDQVLKGDPTMPRRLQVDNCRPLSSQEAALFSQASDVFPGKVRARIGFDRQRGKSFENLVMVPLGPMPEKKPQ